MQIPGLGICRTQYSIKPPTPPQKKFKLNTYLYHDLRLLYTKKGIDTPEVTLLVGTACNSKICVYARLRCKNDCVELFNFLYN